MDNEQIIYFWKLFYWQAISQGREPQKAAKIASQQIGVGKHPSTVPVTMLRANA